VCVNRFNQRSLSRIYPYGFRFSSSNYHPNSAWNSGCQVVALNLQTPGRPVYHNEGKFMDNGGCGYILKPEALLAPSGFNVTTFTSAPDHKPIRLVVTVCPTD
jgi:hypothetical protein